MMTNDQKKELQKKAYGLKQWGDFPPSDSPTVKKQLERNNRRVV